MRNVLEYLEQTAVRVPCKPAFCDEARSFTFSQLLAASRAVGTAAAKQTADRTRPIGVLVGRNAFTPLGFLSALQAGCCYVPLDPLMPAARLNAILKQLDPALILYGPDEAGAAEALAAVCPTLSIEALRKICTFSGHCAVR